MSKNNLKVILLEEGITQADLARFSGLTSGSINRFVNGTRTPSPVTAYKIINALNAHTNSDRKYELIDIFPNMLK